MKKLLFLFTIIISTTINAQTSINSEKESKIEVLNSDSDVSSESFIENFPTLDLLFDEDNILYLEENKTEIIAYSVYKKILSKRRKIMYC
ncbi:hypothetical protein [Polaribacter sp. Asnod1-A03]|uniref:hypothetical protein n=1 Tax=Polaribacter sp. Asnod1-A03 TaxID=3160581 RepID=UPI00386D6489